MAGSFMAPLWMALTVAAAMAQETETPIFRANVAQVKVDVEVRQRNGRPIAGLTRGDFLVFDENQPRDIAYFGRESEPLDLLMLLDVSGSMRRSIEEMAAAAHKALAQLRSGDRVAVMLFARSTEVTRSFTTDFRAAEQGFERALRTQSLGAGTLINASIIAAAQHMKNQAGKGRRAILIVTDNEGLNYQSPDEDVIRTLYEADTVLNAIVVRKGSRPQTPRPGRYVNPDFTHPDVFKIAGQTGGEAVEGGKPGQWFAQMIERIRSRYAIQYAAPGGEPGSFRRIRVELSPAARRRYPDAVVSARAGYFLKRAG
ncbi:MAG: VWA domain-containing protein [Bryobacteraceae bacterium]